MSELYTIQAENLQKIVEAVREGSEKIAIKDIPQKIMSSKVQVETCLLTIRKESPTSTILNYYDKQNVLQTIDLENFSYKQSVVVEVLKNSIVSISTFVENMDFFSGNVKYFIKEDNSYKRDFFIFGDAEYVQAR